MQTDDHPAPGTKAPDFRLPAASGGHVALADYAGQRSVLLWFSKGLHCPFCRRNMARLSQAVARFAERDAEILQIRETLDADHTVVDSAGAVVVQTRQLAMVPTP